MTGEFDPYEDDEDDGRAPVIGCLVALLLTGIAVMAAWLIALFTFGGK